MVYSQKDILISAKPKSNLYLKELIKKKKQTPNM